MQMCRSLAQKEGMLVGRSAGLKLHAVGEISNTAKPGSVVVTILADHGVKYFTKIYNSGWIKPKVCCCLVKCFLAAVLTLCKIIGYLCTAIHQLKMLWLSHADIGTNVRLCPDTASMHGRLGGWYARLRGTATAATTLVHKLHEGSLHVCLLCSQSFDAGYPDPQAHLVDASLKTARSAGVTYNPASEEPSASGAAKQPTAAPEAHKAMAN
jgi:hypothetical protein